MESVPWSHHQQWVSTLVEVATINIGENTVNSLFIAEVLPWPMFNPRFRIRGELQHIQFKNQDAHVATFKIAKLAMWAKLGNCQLNRQSATWFTFLQWCKRRYSGRTAIVSQNMPLSNEQMRYPLRTKHLKSHGNEDQDDNNIWSSCNLLLLIRHAPQPQQWSVWIWWPHCLHSINNFIQEFFHMILTATHVIHWRLEWFLEILHSIHEWIMLALRHILQLADFLHQLTVAKWRWRRWCWR